MAKEWKTDSSTENMVDYMAQQLSDDGWTLVHMASRKSSYNEQLVFISLWVREKPTEE